jgi:hypothetical protein
MKRFIIYTVTVLFLTNCSSEKTISTNNLKSVWEINYVKNQVKEDIVENNVNVYTNIKSYDKTNAANKPLLASCDNLVKEPLNKFSSFAINDKKINIVNTKKNFNQVILSEFDFANKIIYNNDYKAQGNIVLLNKKKSKVEKTEEISLLSIGQSDSLVIWNKKSGKEFVVNEGENIRVVTKGKRIYKGKLNKIFYDSSLNSTTLKIDNYTIPYDAVKSIKIRPSKKARISLLFNALGILFVADIFLQTGILLALGLIFSIIGFFLNLLVISRIKKLKRKFKDQTRNVKINIILSSIFPLLLALSTLIIFVLTYSFSY